MVLLSGEPGIGKSRLIAALQQHLVDQPHASLSVFCSPQHIDSALHPIMTQMERVAGLLPGDTPPERLDKLDAMLARTSTSLENAGLFAEMLSMRNDGRYPALTTTAEQRRQKTLDAFTTQVQALADSAPLLMIFEDAHWSDPQA